MKHLLYIVIFLTIISYSRSEGTGGEDDGRSISFRVNTFGEACSTSVFKFTATYPAGNGEDFKTIDVPLGSEQLNTVFTTSNLDGDRLRVSFRWESGLNEGTIGTCCWHVSNVTLHDDGEELQVESLCNSETVPTLNCNGTEWTCTTQSASFDQVTKSTASVISGDYVFYDDKVQLETPCSDTQVANYQFSPPPDWPCYIEPSSSSLLSSTPIITSTTSIESSSSITTTSTPIITSTTSIESSSSAPIITSTTSIESSSITTTSTPIITSTTSIESSSITTTNTPSTTSPSPITVVSMATSSTRISSTSITSSDGPIGYNSIPTTPSSSDSESTLIPSRIVSTVPVTMTTSTIQPTPSNAANQCSEDGIWRATPAGENATSHNACYNGSVSATRRCGTDGVWKDYHCTVSVQFSDILSMVRENPEKGLEILQDHVPNGDFPTDQYMYLLETIVTVYQKKNISITDEKAEMFLNIANDIIATMLQNNETDRDEQLKQGIRVLGLLDELALTLITPSDKVIGINNIAVTVLEFVEPPPTGVSNIEVDQDFISTPRNVYDPTIETESSVRVASLHYKNLSRLLPPSDPNSTIVSSIISATTNCSSCPVDNLDRNVTIQLQLESKPQKSEQVSCVFIRLTEGQQETQDWNTSGCTTTVNGDLVTCSCNHLTHFAILLSPNAGDVISPTDSYVLNTIGLVLVPISLLCMVLVILTYTLIRSLWSIRNYIHIMLCASLFMAQLVFIIGVDRIENQGACSAVAVILMYLFLVTFMWMLMEGVVLYVTLIRVFITNHKYYIIAFTVASYVPAVYMAIVVPIGFIINVDNIPGHTHFLYYTDDNLEACWLNYQTGFIAAFIVPVCLIVLANVCFFVMAIYVMKKHYKKQERKKVAVTVRHWLKASFSLFLVMGITWITGVLVFLEELIVISYLYVIFVASQGILLFLILVPFSKQVREAYLRILKRKTANSEKLSKFVNFISKPTHSSNTDSKKHSDKGVHHRTNGGIMLGSFEAATTPDSTADIYLNMNSSCSIEPLEETA